VQLTLLLIASLVTLAANDGSTSPFDQPELQHSIRRDKPKTFRYRAGVTIRARGGNCRGIFATIPVPDNWPEQEVKIVDEQTTPHVQRLRYRDVDEGVKQMLVSIPQLGVGQTARAIVTYEVTRYSTLEPVEAASLIVPRKISRSVRRYLGASPHIESRHRVVRTLAKEVAAENSGPDSPWSNVEALYDGVRRRVRFTRQKRQGITKTLQVGQGNHEDLTALFIAVCRASGIPARTVWVHGHCYPEFYLQDEEGRESWIPCQIAGQRAFGSMPDQLPILQKGDNFKVPEEKKRKRFVPEFLKVKSGGGQPEVTFVRDLLPED